MMLPKQASQKTKSSEVSRSKPRKLYILVMGLLGAGKSTFISVLTGNPDIPIGKAAELDGGMKSILTQEVQDYSLIYRLKGREYEIHLIDSPGFDDGTLVDAEVLSRVAAYINTNYVLEERLAGVLYLHDITKGKMGGAAQKNIRMLEKMIGIEKFHNCTLVTTKWGCTTDPQSEEAREVALSTDPKYFAPMLQHDQQHHATMRRFHPKSKAVALEIIKPFLENSFVPDIAKQMADPHGPKLALGQTEAGKVVADSLDTFQKVAETEQELEKVKALQDLLSRQYDETLGTELKQKRKDLQREITLHRVGRWVTRTTIVGGAVAATVLTLGHAAPAFALSPAFEVAVRRQRQEEKRKLAALDEELRIKSRNAHHLIPGNKHARQNHSKDHPSSDGLEYGLGANNAAAAEDILKMGMKIGLAADDGEEDIDLDDVSTADPDLDAEFETEEEANFGFGPLQ